eukprot:TRINITY_DN43058_c0_g1_i1.p1 TRINITY_DN43058_c0_g1~~TRINITY_DN43058_c0_g1_i1.p1  ORF type:complete len:322 (-),score=49.76 TRINITY_DN43058_c0_g1_i1:131-1096(-)
MAIFDGSQHNGLSQGFRKLLESRQPLETITESDGKTVQRIWVKEDRPSYKAELQLDKVLIDPVSGEAACRHATLPAVPVRLLARGPDLTVDENTEFEKEVLVEGLQGQNTILDLKRRLCGLESIAVDDQRIFLPPHELMDEMTLGQCFVQWTGFGLDNWPPKFIVKPALQGFEVFVDVPASRDTAVWDIKKHKIRQYGRRRLVFDLRPSTTLVELKTLLENRLGIPVSRQLLSAQLARPSRGYNVYGHPGIGHTLELDDDSRSMESYGIDASCLLLHMRVNRFDVNGDFIFDDDAYIDDQGFHPAPGQSWIKVPSTSRWRQ